MLELVCAFTRKSGRLRCRLDDVSVGLVEIKALVLLEIGFLGWVGATVGLIWYMVDDAGNFARRQGLLWGSLIAVFFALWLIGMRLT